LNPPPSILPSLSLFLFTPSLRTSLEMVAATPQGLTTLPVDAPIEEIFDVIKRDGGISTSSLCFPSLFSSPFLLDDSSASNITY
jgi:hypothetical protein